MIELWEFYSEKVYCNGEILDISKFIWKSMEVFLWFASSQLATIFIGKFKLLLEILKNYASVAEKETKRVFSTSLWTRLNKLLWFDFITCHVVHYPTPLCLTYAWSFGSLAGACLSIQIASGIVLTTYYTPHIDLAFYSIEHIMRHGTDWTVLKCFFYLMRYPIVFKTRYMKSSKAKKQSSYKYHLVLHKLLVTPEYYLRAWKMEQRSYLKIVMSNLLIFFWLWLRLNRQILIEW